MRVISGSNTGLSNDYYLALDAAGNIFAANYDQNSITEYPATGDGNIAPTRTVLGATTGLGFPYPIATNSTGEVFVGNFLANSIEVFDIAFALISVTPPSGTINGGTPVTLHGYGFEPGATVTFGGLPATDVVVVSSTTITAVTPAHAAGAVDVSVTQDSATSTLHDGYQYVVSLATTGVDLAPTLQVGLLLLLLAGLLLVVRSAPRKRRSHPHTMI